MRSDLRELVLSHDEIADLDPARRRLALRELFGRHLDGDDLGRAVSEAADHIDGWGPLTPVMRAPGITDVFVNGTRGVWVERDGRTERTDIRCAPDELAFLIERLVGDAGGRVDPSHPIADVRLEDGSRMHVVLPPLAPDGPLVSIRRFPREPFTLEDLVEAGMLSADQAGFLSAAVADRRTILISGATGSGKTTLLDALLGRIPESERLVLIEETPELRPACAHSVSLVARPPNIEGAGVVGLDELVRAALRMRPDRIVVGEVRGAEAATVLGALSTGHEGSLLTIHARSAADALDRFVALAIQGTTASTEASIRRSAMAAFDHSVHLTRSDGTRRITSIE